MSASRISDLQTIIDDLEDLIPALMAESLERRAGGATDPSKGLPPTVVDMGSGGQLGEFLSRVPNADS